MKNVTIFLMLFSILTACASPQIYIIDRQTLMEADASGEWPQTEKYLKKIGQKSGPTFFAKTPNPAKQKRLKNILNGEIEK